MTLFKRKHRKIYTSILQRYMLFMFFIILIFIIVLLITTVKIGKTITSTQYSKDIQKYYRASSILKSNYKNIDASKINSIGGWVEILDNNKNVIYIIGSKKDKKNKYSEDDILKFLESNINKNKTTNDYIYSIEVFYNNKNKYYCLVKTPSSLINIDIDKKESTQKYILAVKSIILKSIFIIFISFIIISIFYTHWTCEKIVNPLNKILKGIEGMTFDAENEFCKIKNAFNFMISKIEQSEIERIQNEKYKQELFTDISHDLKTPITSIQGYSKALYDGVVKDDTKKQKFLKVIFEKASRLTTLIENIHALAKLDNDFYTIHKEKVDVCEFLRQIISDFYNDIEQKQFEFIINIPQKEVIYNFDKNEMNRAISNIIHNALKYNNKGTKFKIELKVFHDKFKIIIADNGIGIEENLKHSIFNEFTRGDLSRSTSGGTGIGLSISKKITKKHDGILYLNSSKDFKTIFVFEFKI